MNKNFITLKNRCVISISGADRKTFLQGLITNDINKVSETQAIYTFMLSPQGRFLYDFFIIAGDEKLLLDCNKSMVDEIVQKLLFYKLRSKVEIKKESLNVAASLESLVVSGSKISFVDPRNSQMGVRHFTNNTHSLNTPPTPLIRGEKKDELGVSPLVEGWKKDELGVSLLLEERKEDELGLSPLIRGVGGVFNDHDILEYNLKRINLEVPDDSDLTFDKSFPLEFGFDNFNTIDYQKGCYVGQETTARTHYKGTIRKKIFLVEIMDCNQIEKGTEIEDQDKKIGEILSSVFYENKLLALALIKNLDNEGKEINLGELKLYTTQKANLKANLKEMRREIKIIK